MSITGFEIMLMLIIVFGCVLIGWVIHRLRWAEFNIKLLENQCSILRERIEEDVKRGKDE